jgi:hypothetical protein
MYDKAIKSKKADEYVDNSRLSRKLLHEADKVNTDRADTWLPKNSRNAKSNKGSIAQKNDRKSAINHKHDRNSAIDCFIPNDKILPNQKASLLT